MVLSLHTMPSESFQLVPTGTTHGETLRVNLSLISAKSIMIHHACKGPLMRRFPSLTLAPVLGVSVGEVV